MPVAMDAPLPPPLAPAFKDRYAGLVVFGVFAILIGSACALFVPLIFFGQVMTARRAGTELDVFSAIVAAAIYGLLAATLITLGIGSIRARRWARALLLCLGGIGLAIGLLTVPVVFVAMNSLDETMRAQHQIVPPASLALIKAITLVSSVVIYIVMPLVTVLFYRGANVKRTCEIRDPVERWTDRCPLPVLALCMLKAWSLVIVAFILPTYGRVYPVFGTLVEGWPARLLWIGVMAFLAYAIRGFYRLELRAWWVYTVGSLVLGLSGLVTFQRLGLVEMYRRMGMPEQQVELAAKSPLLQGNTLLWLSLGSVAVWYAYLLFVRRFFRPATGRPAAAGG